MERACRANGQGQTTKKTTAVDSRINRSLEIIHIKKLIPNAVL